MNLLVSHAQQEFPKSMCANQGFAKGFWGGIALSGLSGALKVLEAGGPI